MVNFYEKLGSKKDKKDNEIYCKYPSSDQNSDSISLEDSINRDKKKAQKEQEQFNQKYIPNLDKRQLIKIIEENKDDKEKHDYLYSKLSICGNEENIFTMDENATWSPVPAFIHYWINRNLWVNKKLNFNSNKRIGEV